MGTQLQQFGDNNSADIVLWLFDSEGAEYEENPLYLHSQVLRNSQVLRKCDFYETMLSERWSLDKQRPLQISVTSTHSFDNYIKCLRLMYSSQATTKRFCFASVDDALAILPVAAQLLFHECLHQCMQYLNAVRWTPAQGAELRNLLSSLQLSTVPIELASRLGMNLGNSDINQDLQFLEESLQEMLFTISAFNVPSGPCIWGSLDYRNVVEESIVSYFERTDTPSAVADTCKPILVKAFGSNIEFIKCEGNIGNSGMSYAWCNLLWLVDLIRRCDRGLFGTVFQIFSEDIYLRDTINSLTDKDAREKYIIFALINEFLRSPGNAEIITSTSIRVSFLSNWLKTTVALVNIPEHMDALQTGLVEVAETLPLSEQRRVFQIWKEACEFKPAFRRSVNVMEWWVKKLQDAFANKK